MECQGSRTIAFLQKSRTKISFELNYSIYWLCYGELMPFEMYENQPFKNLLLRNFENLFTRTVPKLIFTN